MISTQTSAVSHANGNGNGSSKPTIVNVSDDDDLGLFDPPAEGGQPEGSQAEPVRVRIAEPIEAPDDEGESTMIAKDAEYDVSEIDADGNVIIDHDGMVILLEPGDFDVVKWSDGSSDDLTDCPHDPIDVSDESKVNPEASDDVNLDDLLGTAKSKPEPTESKPEPSTSESAKSVAKPSSAAEPAPAASLSENLIDSVLNDAESIVRIYDLAKALIENKSSLDTAAEALNTAQDAYDESMFDFQMVMTEFKGGKDKPIQTVDVRDTAPADDEPPAVVGKSNNPPILETASTGEINSDESDWRSISIEVLGFTPAITKRLMENEKKNIRTFGDFHDWTSKHKLTDLDGIGSKKADPIIEAYEKWWTKNPQYSRQGE